MRTFPSVPRMSSSDPPNARRLLLVEDEESLAKILALHLAEEGWIVDHAADGEAALERATLGAPSIVLLDLMLPKLSGLEVCRWLRERSDNVGIVMLTARSAEEDIIAGLDAGADDYVAKPCRPREVVARVAALARRLKRPVGPGDTVTVGKLRFERRARRVTVDGVLVTLTATELALLSSLAAEPGKTFKREELLKEVWETQVAGYARNVDCHITRLRNKLAKKGLPRRTIRTVHGVGYVLSDDPIPGLPLDE